MSEFEVAEVDEVPDGERIKVQVEGLEIAVFNVDGEYHAFLNWCPHQNGPIADGLLGGTMEASFDRESLEVHSEWTREGQIISCPWHSWEFDVESGECLSKEGVQLREFPVREDDGRILLELP